MTDDQSSTKRAAAREAGRPATACERAQFAKIDTADCASRDLHSVLTCMLAVADDESGTMTDDEQAQALSWLQWRAFSMSRDLRKAFA